MVLVKPAFEVLSKADSEVKLIELAGRTCYKSEERITADSAATFVASIIQRGHESVLEHSNIILHVSRELYYFLSDVQPTFLELTHANDRYIVSGNARAWRDFAKRDVIVCGIVATLRFTHEVIFDSLPNVVYVDGNNETYFRELQESNLSGAVEMLAHARKTVKFICDRGVSHEIVRHRIASYSQESTRYCDYHKGEVTFVIPPWVNISEQGEPKDHFSAAWKSAMENAEVSYKYLRACGWKPEQARTVLPNSLKTEIVMTANLREWCLFFRLRISPKAHPQMREIAEPLLNEFKRLFPVVFDDIKPELAV